MHQCQSLLLAPVPVTVASTSHSHGHVYIHNTIPHATVTAHTFTSTINPSQLFWLQLSTPAPMLLGVVYLHPEATAADRAQLTTQLHAVADNAAMPTVVIGDMNAHHSDWQSQKNTANGTALADFLHTSHWTCVNAAMAPGQHTHTSHSHGHGGGGIG